MRAMVINKVGGPEVLEEAELPRPQPGAGQVLIKLARAGVNPVDWKDREGAMQAFFPYVFPYTGGIEGAGIIEEIGQNVDGFTVGDRVLALSDHDSGKPGTFAEFSLSAADRVAHMPASVGYSQAVTVPVSGTTAWNAVQYFSGIQAGHRVLIHGGSGQVGSFAIQFAKRLGAKVAATCSTEKLDYVKGFGADIVIDYKVDDIRKKITAWNNQGVDVIVDTVGHGTLPTALDLLAAAGRLVNIPTLTGDGDVEADTKLAAKRGLEKVMAYGTMDDPSGLMTEILGLIASGVVKTPKIHELPLTQIAQAQTMVRQGKFAGKMVLKIADFE